MLRRGVLGKEDVAVGETLNNLAVCYYMRGACNKAVELYEEALQIFIAHAQGSEEHPMVVLTYYNMALAYQQLASLLLRPRRGEFFFKETTDPAGWELPEDSPPQRPPEVSFLSRLRLEKPGKRNTHDRKTDVENIMRECLA